MKWNDDTGLSFLRAATEPKLWHIFRGKLTLDTALDAMSSSAFPFSQRFIYDRRISQLKQSRFQKIDDLVQAIEVAVLKWGAAINATRKEIEFKIEETFF